MQPTRHTVTIPGRGTLVTGCAGADACPRRTQDAPDLPRAIADAVAAALHRADAAPPDGAPVPPHKTLKVAVSYCPNSCARSQIADVGCIGAATPVADPAPCTACGACSAVCREDAVRLDYEDRIAAIDLDRCVHCGACADACPTGALTVGRRGFRLLLGGKLGRHPRFGDELPGLYTPQELPALAAHAVGVYLAERRPGERMGDVVARLGAAAFLRREAP